MSIKIKSLLSAILLLATGIFFWVNLSSLFICPKIEFGIWLGISFIIFSIFFLLFSILNENRLIVYPTFILFLLGFFIFFKPTPINLRIYSIGLIIFLILLGLGFELIKKEKNQRLKINLTKIWKKGLPLAIIGFSLIISVVYYFNPLIDFSKNKIEIPSQLVGLLLKSTSGLIGQTIPFYDPNMTIDETISATLLTQGQGLSPKDIPVELIDKINLNDLSNINIGELLADPSVKSFLKQQNQEGNLSALISEQRSQLSQALGFEIKGDETMGDILTEIINLRLGEVLKVNSSIISLVIVALLFFILKFVGRILEIIILILTKLIFYVLLFLKVIKVETEMKPCEIIKF